jgi:ATP-dependent Clp protease protease subunit
MKNEFEKYAVKHRGISSLNLHRYNVAMGKKAIVDYNKVGTVVGMTPHVVLEATKNIAIMSVFDRLMQDRILMLGMPIVQEVSNIICAQLLFLDSVDSEMDINLYLDSPGGSVPAGNSIIDVMEIISAPVSTVNMGTCASMAAVILACGETGKRKALKRSRTMIHQVSGGFEGDYTEMSIQIEEAKIARNSLYELLAEKTGKNFKQIEKDCDRDYWMAAHEAKQYGLIDYVFEKKPTGKK